MNPLRYETCGLEAIENNGPSLLFAEHHRSLHRAAEDLMARAHDDDRVALVERFRVFEQQILEHMRAEEELVLPAFAGVEPGEAAAILDGHVLIRKHLEQTAFDVELHCIRWDPLESTCRHASLSIL